MNASTLPALAIRLMRQWWPHLVALLAACGVIAATISGALGVGAALQDGLRRLAVARLGGIEAAVIGDDFFRADLARELAAGAAQGLPDGVRVGLLPALVIEAAVDVAVDAAGRRGSQRATVLACDDPGALGFVGAADPTDGDAVAVNAVLAESLGLRVGDPIVLRVANASAVPADSPLGRRTVSAAGKRLQVGRILPADGLGQFSLRPTQVTGPLVVAPLATVQALLRKGAVANVVFAVATAGVGSDVAGLLHDRIRPSLEDYGLALEEIAGTPPDGRPTLRLTSRRLILAPEVDGAAERVLGPLGGQPSLVFLANTIAAPNAGAPAIPYSTVLGIADAALPAGDLADGAGTRLAAPGPGEILIDRWMADDLAARGRPIEIGDPLEISFFLPETLHGRVEEARHALRVSGIAEMRGAAVAASLVPDVEGVSDEKSIADWDPPFPFDAARVRTTPPHDEDDRYWKQYGTTPKAFVSLETARRLAGSRFGRSTAWHMPRDRVSDLVTLRAELAAAIRPQALGLRVVPLRAEALAAARGSTPFGGLFLALSSFVVAAGLLLEWLLFRLLVAARRKDIGILAAMGWPAPRIVALLALVGGMVAVVGSAIGAAVGPFWSSILLAALSRSWNAAVAAGSQQAFADGAAPIGAMLPGFAASLVVSVAALLWAAWRASRQSPLALLRDGESLGLGAAAAKGPSLAWIAGAAAVGLAAAAAGLRGDQQQAVTMFFLSGVALLTAMLLVARRLLGSAQPTPVGSLPQLAWRGIAARPARAFAIVAIVAIAEFLIVALSSFALAPPGRPRSLESPTGGWTQIASFGVSNGIDPADVATQESLGLTDAQRRVLAECTVARVRSNAGEDASCTNLYAAARPTVLGVDRVFLERGGFRFVDHAPLAAGVTNPWLLLEGDGEAAPRAPIPAVLDQATAQWALKLGGVGARFDIADDEGHAVEFEIVALLEPGILQGSVIVAEDAFVRAFPRRSGYALALVAAPAGGSPQQDAAVADAIRAAWADAGVTVQSAAARLASLSAVQNTFLAGFQALGTLGLLLGTAGVAAVQIQGAIERLGQFALLLAVGFTPGRLRGLVVLETLLLVGLGLGVGVAAAGLALLPAFLGGRATVPLGWAAATCLLTLLVASGAGLVAAGRAARLQPSTALRSL